MKHIVISLVVFCSIGVDFAVAQTKKVSVSTTVPVVQPVEVDYVAGSLAALEAGDVSGAEKLVKEIKNPAAKLYVQACIERAKGGSWIAMQTVTKGIALHYHDQEWIAKSELLSAELYIELNMLDEADVTARQIQALYTEADVVKKADALRSKIEELNKAKTLKETVKE